jgi:hypothetical protein
MEAVILEGALLYLSVDVGGLLLEDVGDLGSQLFRVEVEELGVGGQQQRPRRHRRRGELLVQCFKLLSSPARRYPRTMQVSNTPPYAGVTSEEDKRADARRGGFVVDEVTKLAQEIASHLDHGLTARRVF